MAGVSPSGTTGSLEGYVTEEGTGVPLPGANVLLVETRQGANTDARGFFKIHNIRAGSYRVQVSLIGYGTVESKAIVVVPDRRSEFNVALAENPIEMEATIVTHARPLISDRCDGHGLRDRFRNSHRAPGRYDCRGRR